MASIDNLNFYNTWLPAGQLTDRYSSQPWCLRSKNLDIFSSSKSVKATAWSTPVSWDTDIIKQDWSLILKNDGKVYELVEWQETLLVDPSTNFPVRPVSYTWSKWPFSNAQWGTVQDLVAKYEWDVRKAYTVFTDKASYNYSKVKYTFDKELTCDSDAEYDTNSPYLDNGYGAWYVFKKYSWYPSSNAMTVNLIVKNSPFVDIPIRISAYEPNSTNSTISLYYVRQYPLKWYYYDAELDSMQPVRDRGTAKNIPFSWSITNGWVNLTLPSYPWYSTWVMYEFYFMFTKRDGASNYSWTWWKVYIDMNWWSQNNWRMFTDWTLTTKSEWDSNYYYTYLPVRERKITPIWEYYWMKGTNFQPLYDWSGNWADINWEKKLIYDFVQYMGWNNDPAMDIIDMVVWNEQVYMIWNLNWNWYIIPCDLTGGRWTPYIAYWCTFRWATNIDYLMYLVWEDRGISQLWVYNGQELVSILGWTEEKDTKNLIDNQEQYKFDWNMVEYRGDLVLSTSDNRIFAYWQTFGGKGWTFIHQLPWTIKDLKADWNDLSVTYTVSSTDYITNLQDDTPIKKYNTEWMAEYPIVIWNHLLEKEESDLYASYILPSANCSLEFWGMANHYHFRTFTSADSYTFSTAASYKMKGCSGNYALKFIEKNGNQYTFRLEWDLPIQTTNDMKITDSEWTELITYSEYNHFRKIWDITTDKYVEWEFRFTNLNNKLDLPKSHSLQIMVKGKGTANHTPELFALDLVANQRERW